MLCPVLVNTSFNVRGEPIACTPRGRLLLLHGQRDRGVRRRRLLDAERAPGPGTEARLSERPRSGLMSQVPSYPRLASLPPESEPAGACRDPARPRCSAAALRILFLTRYR